MEADVTQPLEVLGELTVEEQDILTRGHHASQQIVHRIGMLEVEKSRMLVQLAHLENAARQNLQIIGERLGIPQDRAWQVSGNKVIAQPLDPKADDDNE